MGRHTKNIKTNQYAAKCAGIVSAKGIKLCNKDGTPASAAQINKLVFDKSYDQYASCMAQFQVRGLKNCNKKTKIKIDPKKDEVGTTENKHTGKDTDPVKATATTCLKHLKGSKALCMKDSNAPVKESDITIKTFPFNLDSPNIADDCYKAISGQSGVTTCPSDGDL